MRVVVLVGRHAVDLRVELLAVGEHVVVEQRGGVGMGRAARDGDRGGQHHCGRQDEPVDRRALDLHAVDVVAEDAEHQRDLAGDDAAGAVGVAGAHRHAVVAELAKELQAALFAHRFDQRREPLDVGRLHADALFPFWLEQLRPGLG